MPNRNRSVALLLRVIAFLIVVPGWLARVPISSAAPLALHPANPHYFLYKDRATILIGSGEHYGAVVNLDFDYVKYLDAVAAAGLNLTRTFSGTYFEPEGAFNIAKNTLAPQAARFISPWERDEQSRKFDLKKFNPAYFDRLRDFVKQAESRGIVIELTLFCPMYEEAQWSLSPMNALNNVNGIGAIGRNDVHTLDKNGALLEVQESLVRKIVSELRDAENLCYEICNEPYFGGVTIAWQHHIADVIVEAEKEFAHQHLITQNIANGAAKIESPHPAVSVFNFHYAHPPDAIALNYELDKVIGDNETGFKGTADDHYRMEAWEFLLAGGGLFNHLDYSFAVGHEAGTFAYPATQPGGGNATFREQMKFLKDFIHGFDFVKMRPARELISGDLPEKLRYQVLAEPGKQYAAYFKGAPGTTIGLRLPPGDYRAQWLDVVRGKADQAQELQTHPGGVVLFQIPPEPEESALRILRE